MKSLVLGVTMVTLVISLCINLQTYLEKKRIEEEKKFYYDYFVTESNFEHEIGLMQLYSESRPRLNDTIRVHSETTEYALKVVEEIDLLPLIKGGE